MATDPPSSGLTGWDVARRLAIWTQRLVFFVQTVQRLERSNSDLSKRVRELEVTLEKLVGKTEILQSFIIAHISERSREHKSFDHVAKNAQPPRIISEENLD